MSQLAATTDPKNWTDTELLDYLQESGFGMAMELMDDGKCWFMIFEDADVSIGEDPDLRAAIRQAAIFQRQREAGEAW